jgi:hypothetical protein
MIIFICTTLIGVIMGAIIGVGVSKTPKMKDKKGSAFLIIAGAIGGGFLGYIFGYLFDLFLFLITPI